MLALYQRQDVQVTFVASCLWAILVASYLWAIPMASYLRAIPVASYLQAIVVRSQGLDLAGSTFFLPLSLPYEMRH